MTRGCLSFVAASVAVGVLIAFVLTVLVASAVSGVP